MVAFIFYDSDGTEIGLDKIKHIQQHNCDWYEVHLKDYVYSKLSDEEMFTLMQLINKRIEYGVHVEEAKVLIHLLDKLEKIHERKYSK